MDQKTQDSRQALSTTEALPDKPYLPPENLARLETHVLRPHGEPRVNPPDYSISVRSKFGTDQQLHYPGERRQKNHHAHLEADGAWTR